MAVDIENPQDDTPDYDGLVAFLQQEEARSDEGDLQEERANAIDFYNGEPFGDEEDGRSQVVTRDVAEVIDYMTVAVLKTMASSDRAVEFDISEPPRPKTEPAEGQPSPPKPPSLSEVVTAAVSREFFQGQDGYRVVHDWIKAGLLEKSSVCKVCVEEQEPKRLEAVVPIAALALMQEQGIELVAARDMEDGTFAVAWLEPRPPIFRDYVVPNEEFRVAADARDMDKGCLYDCFIMPKTDSELLEMGFDTSDLGDEGYGADDEVLRNARDGNRDTYNNGNYRTGANKRYWLREEYARYDLNGDGVAELLKVFRVGNTVLDVEEIDEQPGVIWCPFPMPGRLVGQSLADKVMDIQRVNSVALRQVLDGFYLANKPRTWINEQSMGDTTIDDLLNPNVGAIIRWKGNIKPETIPSTFDLSSGLALMEKLNGEKESRTGITRLNQGMDADALNKTATGTAMMQQQGQQIEEYVARNFAEAFARLMLKKYRLMRRFGTPLELMVDGQMIQVDPRQWPDDANVVVRVGLGSGRKDQRIQYRTAVLGIAQQALAGGARMFSEENLYNNIRGLIADMNLGPINELITDPSGLPPQEDEPDPDAKKAEAEAMLAAQRLQLDQQKMQQEAMLKERDQQVNAALSQQKTEADLAAKREKAALDEQLARDKATFEADLAERQFMFESQLAIRQQEFNESMAARTAAVKETQELPNKRPGGDLDK